MKLKDLLPIIFANRFVIANADQDMLIIWQGTKHEAGYEILQRVYANYNVDQIRIRKDGVAYITISKEWLL